jgi:superfamily II DNA or RNA helicase
LPASTLLNNEQMATRSPDPKPPKAATRPTQDNPYGVLLAEVQASFDATTLKQAEACVSGVVLEDTSEPGSLDATVAEPHGRVHEVWVQAMQVPTGVQWFSDCTCPEEFQCKHGAAVLLAALRGPAGPVQAPGAAPVVREQVLQWAHRQRAAGAGPGTRPPKAAAKPVEALFYGLLPERDRAVLRIYKSRLDSRGQPAGKSQLWFAVDQALLNPPRFVAEADLAALRLLRTHAHGGMESWVRQASLPNDTLPTVLPVLLGTGRLGLDLGLAPEGDRVRSLKRLRLGPPLTATLAWRGDAAGRQQAMLSLQGPSGHVVAGSPTWYLDGAAGLASPVDVPGLPPDMLAGLLGMPALSTLEAAMVASTLAEVAPGVARPQAQALRQLRDPLVPVLRLATQQLVPAPWGGKSLRGYKPASYNMDTKTPQPMSWATLGWCYGPFQFQADSAAAGHSHFRDADGQWVELHRDHAAERAAQAAFHAQGFRPAPTGESVRSGKPPPEGSFILEDESAWPPFMAQVVPALRAKGWQVEWDRQFMHGLYRAQGFFSALRAAPPAGEEEAAEGASPTQGWLLELGIEVQGRRLALPPLLADLLKREPRWFDTAQVAAMPSDEPVTLFTSDGWRIEVDAGRLKPIVRTLIDLFDGVSGDGPLRLSRWDALRLDELRRDPHWAFQGDAALQVLADRLRAGQGVQPVPAPAGLQIELRPYQLQGLAWLQFLRQHDLAGILADDMGLGKTAQTLAHVLAEKQAGRLESPALVVLPTSLVFNWQAEAQRIAPALRVLVLHGKERAGRFDAIAQHDLVLTTYPLVWRDIDELKKHRFHLLVLDEAQAVKNAAGRGAEAVRQLQARHRLCLTGTPLENNLGELWAQFDFLLPGLLGSARDFTRRWRSPIEKQGHTLRAEALAARIRPFLLRRRKEDVAKELPPKTEVLRRVALEGAQRDLYETVRAAMDEQVRREIAAKGLARSHIMVLDALLKLRQVCCDPRLLKRRTLPEGMELAKLDALDDMLQELVAEGRRILVFSQFAEMLALIAQRLQQRGMAHVVLTGRTRDRQAVVQRFQQGEVPVFLVSLKAGGVGLNLTAADTVIHFDPWWNPAAEAQATDRAHRIGQDKPVFVYKLVAAGSIEERILALQQRKAGLAESVLGKDGEEAVKFGQQDIDALLAPLE